MLDVSHFYDICDIIYMPQKFVLYVYGFYLQSTMHNILQLAELSGLLQRRIISIMARKEKGPSYFILD